MKKIIPFLILVALIANACNAQAAQTESTATAVPSQTSVPIPTNIPLEVISLDKVQAMPQWVAGEMRNSGDPGGSAAVRVDENTIALNALRLHGLAPVTDAMGMTISYQGADGAYYFPLMRTFADTATGAPMTAVGTADEHGVVTFRSGDGAVTEQFLASLQCPDGVTCVQAVSFNSDTPEREGDAGVLYFLQIDDKGKIVRHVASGVAADAVVAGEEIPWVDGASEVWQQDLSGEAALAQIMRQGTILWDGDEYVFESDGTEFTALPHEVTLTTDFGGLVQSDEGVFVWDAAKSDWVAASAVSAADGAEWGMWSAEGREFVIIDGEGHWVESSAVGEDGGVTLTLSTGERMVWNGEGWEGASELNMTFEDWKTLVSGPYVGIDGKNYPDKWVSFTINDGWGIEAIYTDPSEIGKLPADTVLIVLNTNGEMVVWVTPEEAAQMVEDGATAMVPFGTMPMDQVRMVLLASRENGGETRVVFRENTQLGFLGRMVAIDIVRDMAVADASGQLVVPGMLAPPEHFKVSYRDASGQRISEEWNRDFTDPEHWAQEIIDAGYTAIEIYPSAPR